MHIIIPKLPFFYVSKTKLPVFIRFIYAIKKALALLFL